MLRSWKTTVVGVAGIITAGLTAKGYINADAGAAITALIAGIIGIIAKDANVSGS